MVAVVIFESATAASTGIVSLETCLGADKLDKCTVLFSPSSFSAAEWKSLTTYRTASVLSYDFGIPSYGRPQHERAMEQLLGTGTDSRQPFKCGVDDECHAELIGFESSGCVSRVIDTDSSIEWVMTDLGREKLHQRILADSPVPALVARPGIVEDDLTVFELLFRLENAGWECFVKEPRVTPSPYKPGGVKAFWMKEAAETFSTFYLRALLHGAEIVHSVEHFRENQYYIDLLEGKEPLPPQKHGKGMFKFSAEEYVDVVKRPPKKRQRTKSKDSPKSNSGSSSDATSKSSGKSRKTKRSSTRSSKSSAKSSTESSSKKSSSDHESSVKEVEERHEVAKKGSRRVWIEAKQRFFNALHKGKDSVHCGYSLDCMYHPASGCVKTCGNGGLLHGGAWRIDQAEVRERLLTWEAAGKHLPDDAKAKEKHIALGKPLLTNCITVGT